MERIDVFKEIKARVPILDSFRFYGIKLNRGNQTLCLYHNEKTPSLTVFPKRNNFYCFGCGKYGTVIDLAQKLFNLSEIESAKKLDSDFNLHLFTKPITPTEKSKYNAMVKSREEENKLELEYEKWERGHLDYLIKNIGLYQKLLEMSSPSQYGGKFISDFKMAIDKIQLLEYEYETLSFGSLEEKISLYLNSNKGVALWA